MNILIVDDQINVVNGLLKGVNWRNLGITEIYKAYNAYEAKALFNNLSIDILMTDIEMPGETGIHLVKWVREHNYETECIFLTSHADFEYARDAVKVGSFEYVLQPCTYEEIEAIVSSAIYKINQKKEQMRFYTCGKFAMDDDLMSTIMFRDSLKMKENEGMIQVLQTIGIFSGCNTRGYLTLLQVMEKGITFEELDRKQLECSIRNITSKFFHPFEQKIIITSLDDSTYAFFCYHDTSVLDSKEYKKQLLLLIELFQRVLNITFTYFSGELIEVESLHEQYQKLERLRENSVSNQELMEREDNPVDELISYIHEHLEEDLKRTELADLVHLNIDYLARKFKKETGYTINDFIIMEKIKLAQNLIHTTLLPIGLIATKVGYSNFSYFSKLYKKVTGVSPLEDRNNKLSNPIDN